MLNIFLVLEEVDYIYFYKGWRLECRELGNGKSIGFVIIVCYLFVSCYNILFLYIYNIIKDSILYKCWVNLLIWIRLWF